MKKVLFLLFGALLFQSAGQAQSVGNKSCGYDYVRAALLARNPNFETEHAALISNALKTASIGAKTTGTSITVPVIFHIVLDSANLKSMDPSTIRDRVLSQINVLNEDYNRGNADSVNIPSPFQPLYGKPNIRFALAGLDPNGHVTPGYEVVVTSKSGFEANTSDPGSDAKHDATGGANAWDVTKYINVWVINFLLNGGSSTIIGLTIAPSYTVGVGGYPKSEIGILLRHDAFGRRSSPTENFFLHIDKGRTLTHEMGHYFEMVHIWGDDGGQCPGSGGTDDGIADTPPQADATYGCPSFPKYDACTNISPGIMFMNYMDYTDDSCMYMFTNDQAAVMHSNIVLGGESYALTQHPELLTVPTIAVNNMANNIVVYPNPSKGSISLTFTQPTNDLKQVTVINTMGQKVWEKNINNQETGIINIDLQGAAKGIYFLECQYSNGKDVRKIVLQ